MEGFDVVEDHGLGVVSGWRNNVVKTLGFESGPERFGGGVIVTVSPSTHALVDIELSQGGSEVMAGVLAALIAVVDEAGKAPSALGDGLVECFEHETGFHGVASGPSEDTAAKEVQLGGEEEPAFGGGNVSKVGLPRLDWALWVLASPGAVEGRLRVHGNCPGGARGMKRPLRRACSPC